MPGIKKYFSKICRGEKIGEKKTFVIEENFEVERVKFFFKIREPA